MKFSKVINSYRQVQVLELVTYSNQNLWFSTTPKSHHNANVFSGCRMIEYYREYNGRCIKPVASQAQEGNKIVLQKSCQGEGKFAITLVLGIFRPHVHGVFHRSITAKN